MHNKHKPPKTPINSDVESETEFESEEEEEDEEEEDEDIITRIIDDCKDCDEDKE